MMFLYLDSSALVKRYIDEAADDSPHAVECELVEDGGAFVGEPETSAQSLAR